MKCWNFKNLLSHHLLKFQEQESLTDFEYMLLRKFSVSHRDLNWLSLSTKLHKEGLLRNFPLGKAKMMWLSWSWVKIECAGNM
jgi:hypothetical protein